MFTRWEWHPSPRRGRRHRRELTTNYSYFSTFEAMVHIGLGPATQIDHLQVEWASGDRQDLYDLPAGERHELIEPVILRGLGSQWSTELHTPNQPLLQLNLTYHGPGNKWLTQSLNVDGKDYPLPRIKLPALQQQRSTIYLPASVQGQIESVQTLQVTWTGVDTAGAIDQLRGMIIVGPPRPNEEHTQQPRHHKDD